jgi:hypothetical protein
MIFIIKTNSKDHMGVIRAKGFQVAVKPEEGKN